MEAINEDANHWKYLERRIQMINSTGGENLHSLQQTQNPWTPILQPSLWNSPSSQSFPGSHILIITNTSFWRWPNVYIYSLMNLSTDVIDSVGGSCS